MIIIFPGSDSSFDEWISCVEPDRVCMNKTGISDVCHTDKVQTVLSSSPILRLCVPWERQYLLPLATFLPSIKAYGIPPKVRRIFRSLTAPGRKIQ